MGAIHLTHIKNATSQSAQNLIELSFVQTGQPLLLLWARVKGLIGDLLLTETTQKDFLFHWKSRRFCTFPGVSRGIWET